MHRKDALWLVNRLMRLSNIKEELENRPAPYDGENLYKEYNDTLENVLHTMTSGEHADRTEGLTYAGLVALLDSPLTLEPIAAAIWKALQFGDVSELRELIRKEISE